MTVAELLCRISAREIMEWMEFERLEPFGADAMFFGHAITASTIANRFRGEGEALHKIAEFMPPFEAPEEPKPQTVEEQMQFATMMTMALGGQDLRKDK